MAEGLPRFRFIYQTADPREPLRIYFRIQELGADGDYRDTSPYGPLLMEIENFMTFRCLIELGARLAGISINDIKWEPFNAAFTAFLRQETEKDKRGEDRKGALHFSVEATLSETMAARPPSD